MDSVFTEEVVIFETGPEAKGADAGAGDAPRSPARDTARRFARSAASSSLSKYFLLGTRARTERVMPAGAGVEGNCAC